jgi:hypothetical protein
VSLGTSLRFNVRTRSYRCVTDLTHTTAYVTCVSIGERTDIVTEIVLIVIAQTLHQVAGPKGSRGIMTPTAPRDDVSAEHDLSYLHLSLLYLQNCTSCNDHLRIHVFNV